MIEEAVFDSLKICFLGGYSISTTDETMSSFSRIIPSDYAFHRATFARASS